MQARRAYLDNLARKHGRRGINLLDSVEAEARGVEGPGLAALFAAAQRAQVCRRCGAIDGGIRGGVPRGVERKPADVVSDDERFPQVHKDAAPRGSVEPEAVAVGALRVTAAEPLIVVVHSDHLGTRAARPEAARPMSGSRFERRLSAGSAGRRSGPSHVDVRPSHRCRLLGAGRARGDGGGRGHGGGSGGGG